MKKIFSFLFVALFSVSLWAYEGGTLTSTTNPIFPTSDVTLSYDGDGTNFAAWEPKCFIHTWLSPVEGQTFSKDYGTTWADCNSDGDYAALDDKVKMTFVKKGQYTISMNIKTFFNVADEDLEKIAKLYVVVRAQYNGDNNRTNNLEIPVAYNYYMKNSWGAADWTWRQMTKDGSNYKLENVVFGGSGVDINRVQSDTGKDYVLASNFLGYQPEAYDTVTLVLAPAAGTITATLLGKYRPTINLFGAMGTGAWTDGDDFVLANDRSSASISVNFANTGYYHFKVKSDGTELGKNNGGNEYGLHSTWTSVSGLGDGSDGLSLDVSRTGSYTFTYTFEGSVLEVVYPSATAIDNTAEDVKAVKRIENGQLVIIKNGVKYNALGAEVK